jgi:hypothetical protein
MPKLGLTMTEGLIVEWKKAEGDQVKRGDMIGEAVLGMSMKMTVQELARAVHPHPSLSEAVMESALSLCGGATHMP